jgi:hypothetical protein
VPLNRGATGTFWRSRSSSPSPIPRHSAAARARVLPVTPSSRSHPGDPPDRDGGRSGRQDAVTNVAQPRGGGGRHRPPTGGPPRQGVRAPCRRPGPSVPASYGSLRTFSGTSSRTAPSLVDRRTFPRRFQFLALDVVFLVPHALAAQATAPRLPF